MMNKIFIILFTLFSIIGFSQVSTSNSNATNTPILNLDPTVLMSCRPIPFGTWQPIIKDSIKWETNNINGLLMYLYNKGDLRYPIANGTSGEYIAGNGSKITFPTIPSNTSQISESGNLYYTDARFDTRFTSKTTSDLTEGTNLYYTPLRFSNAFAAKSTSDLIEGLNLYYTDSRFDTRFAAKSTSDLVEGTKLYYNVARFNMAFADKTTSSLTEGSNLYYTDARFNTAFASKSTTDLPEGSNLYFTNSRVRSALSLTTSGSGASTYDSVNGIINVPIPTNQTITLSGDVTGSGATSITTTLVNAGTAGTYGRVTTDSKGRVVSGKRQDPYTGTTNASGVYTVTFGTPYSVAPNIQADIVGGTSNQVITMTASTTGFTTTVVQRNSVNLLGVDLLLSTTVNVNGATVDVLITEK